MKLKASVRYFIRENVVALSVYYGIILCMYMLFIFAYMRFKGSVISMGGLDFSSSVFISVVGLNSFKSPFRMFLQNGYSRRSVFTGFALSGVLMSGVLSLLDSLSSLGLSRIIPYSSGFVQMYSERYTEAESLLSLPEGFLWRFTFYLLFITAGYLIAALYYRMSKLLKVLVSAGVPVFLVILLPIIDSTLAGGAIYRGLYKFISFTLGFRHGANPYIAVLSFMVFTAVSGFLAFLLIRRAAVQE